MFVSHFRLSLNINNEQKQLIWKDVWVSNVSWGSLTVQEQLSLEL